MRLGHALSLRLSLTCTVCDRALDADQRQEDEVQAALFGAKPYTVCPGCGLIVHSPQLLHDPTYRRQARVKVFETTGQVWP